MNAPLKTADLRASERFRMTAHQDGIAKGEVLLEVENVSLSFGGVKAITNISFDIRKGEIRAGNNEVRVWALMGMSNFLGLRYALWERDVPFDEIVDTIADLFRNGLTLDGKEKP